jgi:hypothetical protein
LKRFYRQHWRKAESETKPKKVKMKNNNPNTPAVTFWFRFLVSLFSGAALFIGVAAMWSPQIGLMIGCAAFGMCMFAMTTENVRPYQRASKPKRYTGTRLNIHRGSVKNDQWDATKFKRMIEGSVFKTGTHGRNAPGV